MSNEKPKALVVLSGGQDSTTCLFAAKELGYEIHAITFDYNQRHAREIQAAKDVAKLAGCVSHEIVTVGPLLQGASPLTKHDASLEQYNNFNEMDEIIGDRVELTFVPMRNAFFLTLAANHAVAKGIFTLVTGVCEADNANYPDCRSEFIRVQEHAINLALGLEGANAFRILTPLIHTSKRESIFMSVGMEGAFAALAFSHTAYSGEYPPVTQDHATVLRAHGFQEAGLPDPLFVRAALEGKIESYPKTSNYSSTSVLEKLEEDIKRCKEVLSIM